MISWVRTRGKIYNISETALLLSIIVSWWKQKVGEVHWELGRSVAGKILNVEFYWWADVSLS